MLTREKGSRTLGASRYPLIAVGFAAAAVLVSGCASSAGTKAAQTPATPSVSTKVVTVPASPPSTDASSVRAAISTATAALGGSFAMPNEVGQVLQTAQDDIQRVSGDPVFFTHSHDVLGSRFQVLDDNWQVCGQNVLPGQRVGPAGHIDFAVVKLSENCP